LAGANASLSQVVRSGMSPQEKEAGEISNFIRILVIENSILYNPLRNLKKQTAKTNIVQQSVALY